MDANIYVTDLYTRSLSPCLMMTDEGVSNRMCARSTRVYLDEQRVHTEQT